MTDKKIYHLDIVTLGGTVLANAYGSIAVVNYVAKDVLDEVKKTDESVSVTFVEVENIGGANRRTVLTLTADAETAAGVLESGIRKEKKIGRTATEGDAVPAEPAPTAETQVTDPNGHTEF